MQEKHGYWIHHRVKDETIMGGWKYLPTCDCSNCRYTVNIEKNICPSCHAKMDLEAKDDVYANDNTEIDEEV